MGERYGWAAVVPVKPLAAAKTRLRGAVPGVAHPDLVLALAADTVAAVRACPEVAEVLVVTDDPLAATALGALGARVVADRPDAGLNPALAYAADLLAPGPPAPELPVPGPPAPELPVPGPPAPGAPMAGPPALGRPVADPRAAGRPVAALTADLPALRPDELAAVLAAVARSGRRGFVPDSAGSGTTVLAAPAGHPLGPRFGPDSAARHAASGARRLAGDWPSVRRDVDTSGDLAAARRLGLGPRTARLFPDPHLR